MFILAFFAVYGLINFYLYRVVAAGYPEHASAAGAAIGALFLALFAAAILERRKRYKASSAFAWIGYTWLGVSGIALFYAAALDVAQIAVAGLTDRLALQIVAVLTLASTLYGMAAARAVTVKRVSIASPKLADLDRPLTVVQISDMHLGDGSSLAQTRRVVAMANALKPDIVVSTGDLFDGFLPFMEPYAEALRGLEAPLGKFAIPGNHEVYAGLETAMELTRAAGFRPLRDEALKLEGCLAIVGVEDPASPGKRDEAAVLATAGARRFALLLKHRPEIDPACVGKFDLQLSGHTHGGQIFPFHLLVRLQTKARVGLSRVAGESWLYHSRGTGCWGPQIRFLAPPEIACLTLTGPAGDDGPEPVGLEAFEVVPTFAT